MLGKTTLRLWTCDAVSFEPRYACLELLGFVGQLKQTHRRLLCRMDVIKTLLTVLVRPKPCPRLPLIGRTVKSRVAAPRRCRVMLFTSFCRSFILFSLGTWPRISRSFGGCPSCLFLVPLLLSGHCVNGVRSPVAETRGIDKTSKEHASLETPATPSPTSPPDNNLSCPARFPTKQ